MNDLASLLGGLLLGTESPGQHESCVGKGSRIKVDLRIDLLGGRVVLESNLYAKTQESERKAVSSVEGDCGRDRLLTMYEGMMKSSRKLKRAFLSETSCLTGKI